MEEGRKERREEERVGRSGLGTAHPCCETSVYLCVRCVCDMCARCAMCVRYVCEVCYVCAICVRGVQRVGNVVRCMSDACAMCERCCAICVRYVCGV